MKLIKNIFLIDDDDVFVFIAKKIIAQTQMVEKITSFNNGKDALIFLEQHADFPESLPDLILLDLSMPVMDGWQFLEECSSLNLKLQKKITTYICSSSISAADFDRAKNISAVSDYIIKPISKEKIVEVIKRCSENKIKANKQNS